MTDRGRQPVAGQALGSRLRRSQVPAGQDILEGVARRHPGSKADFSSALGPSSVFIAADAILFFFKQSTQLVLIKHFAASK
jgi:hypothetical protein